MKGDAAAIAREMAMIWQEGSTYELRVIIRPGRTVSGYYDTLEHFARDAAQWDGQAAGVYITLNPVNPALLARSSNHAKDYARSTTQDHDIIRRLWLPLDFDPIRPVDVSSSENEHKVAIERAVEAARWLVSEQVARGSIVLADSGNGAHLLIRIDLPNDEPSKALVQQVIEAASLLFDDAAVSVDPTSFNASRIWKVYGTHACKGDNVPERPHRQAKVLRVGS